MKFMLVVLITMGSPVIGEESKTFELRIPQESEEQCLKVCEDVSVLPTCDLHGNTV